MVLYVDSCIREDSRTERFAKALLDTLGPYEEVRLSTENLRPLNRKLYWKKLYAGTD